MTDDKLKRALVVLAQATEPLCMSRFAQLLLNTKAPWRKHAGVIMVLATDLQSRGLAKIIDVGQSKGLELTDLGRQMAAA